WMTKASWDPSMPLTWNQMEFLGRPNPVLSGSTFSFDVAIPSDRSGHHVLWVAWQRNDPVGEVFVSTSDLEIVQHAGSGEDFHLASAVNGPLTTLPDVKPATAGDIVSVGFESPNGGYDGTIPVLIASLFPTGNPPPSPFGYPEVHIDPLNHIVAYDGLHGSTTGGLAPLLPGGLAFSYPVVAGFNGWSVNFQAFSLSGSALTGHVITSTDAHEFKIF
ncbi:MAG: lytic polysaccharide monooxygenase, partial [Salinibacterium sp.]|nr:lytic polysaccharide monooxygenase [Salinibacterium sp.]